MSGIGVLRDLLGGPNPENRYYGVAVGVVTNNQDPDGLARVKVRFPWLSDNDESYWARVVSPMAGKDRGLYLLPEVDDEVLVAFEHGMVDYPYVLGALWNGKDGPPESNSDGNNNVRVLKSRSGSLIRLDDSQGKEKVEIIGANGGASIVFDMSDNSVTVEAKGTLKLHGQQVEIKGDKVDIN